MSPPERAPLDGQTTLILGGSSGIGLATARAAADAGSRVVLAARHQARLDAALRGFDPARASAVSIDATDMDAVERGLGGIGPVDHVVLSVGTAGAAPAPFAETSMQTIRQAFDHHYWAAVHVLKACLPRVPKRSTSSIVFVTGGLSRRPVRGKAYTTSYQRALDGLAQALIDELAPIRVNTVMPGLCATPLWRDLDDADRRALFAGAIQENPVGFVPDAAPVARAIVAMMTNTYISGASLSVDGGWAKSRL